MSSGNKSLHQQQLAMQRQAMQQQQQQFEQLSKPTPEQELFRKGQANWTKFLDSKDFSKPPTETILNFDLWNPAHVQKQREKMADLEGIGAAGMGGGGKSSIALELARERNANLAAQDAGAAYEQAIRATDQYYKTGALPYAQLDISKGMGLLNNATQREMGYNQAAIQTRPQSMLPLLFGGLLGAGGALLGNPGLFNR